MYSCSFLPLNNKPTRVVKKTATLIDNIFTNDLQMDVNTLNGILLANISDHFPIFHIVLGSCYEKRDNVIIKRKITDENISKFIAQLGMRDWSDILAEDDLQSAYDKFHNVFASLYDTCFS